MSGSGYGPAVTDGRIQYVSPSSINLHDNCKRRYWYKYVARLPDDPPSRAMQYGVDVHKRIETYLTTGVDVLGPAERKALEAGYIPPPSNSYLVEKKTSEGVPLLAAGLPVKGSADLISMEPGYAVVTDWKTTSRLSNKDTTPDSLTDAGNGEGRQMLAYAEWARLNTGAHLFHLRHVQIQIGSVNAAGDASGPFKVAQVVAHTTDRWVESAWSLIGEKYVEPMKATAAAKRPEDVAGNEGFCEAYHRKCPYWSACDVPRKNTNSVLLGLLGISTTPVPQQGVQTVSILDQIKRVSTLPTPAPVPPQVVAAPPEVVNPAAAIQAATPPEAYEPEFRVAAYTTSFTAPPTSFKDPETGEVKPIGGALMTAGPDEEPAAGKKRGRPPKATQPEGEQGWKLFINCEPNLPYKSLLEHTLLIEKDILAAYNESVPDVRLSDNKQIGFGKYKALLANMAKERPPAQGVYKVILGDDDRVDAVALALFSIAKPGFAARGSGR